MGSGVAEALARTGHRVVLVDLTDDILERARATITTSLRLSRLYDKASAAPPNEIVQLIQLTTDYADLAEVDFLVENTVEIWDVKREVYPRLDAVCPIDTVFAANTSCISITRIGSTTSRPDRIVGMHFMNPVPAKPTAEVIRGHHTSDATLLRARQFLDGLGKNCIVVNDSPGFVTNRVLMLTINEAIYLVHENVAEPRDIDQLFKSCFGHKMGPLETADLIGLDTILDSVEVLYDSFSDSKFRPCPLLRKMVDAGLHGRKTKRGFYDYD
ncbi:MAG: 3-hydroxyacyl-CoA dehydrogenase NAD-binding domain-containing protein [Chloroflexota bacterium]|nr:3-hydroxyacyl-CoA dehydrogenase NAD-binding domain-containing protein [Chloroflexota bacterium]